MVEKLTQRPNAASNEPLVQLPNGTWLRLSLVQMVEVDEEKNLDGTRSGPPRVFVHIEGDRIQEIYCQNREEAERTRDEIATQVRMRNVRLTVVATKQSQRCST